MKYIHSKIAIVKIFFSVSFLILFVFSSASHASFVRDKTDNVSIGKWFEKIDPLDISGFPNSREHISLIGRPHRGSFLMRDIFPLGVDKFGTVLPGASIFHIPDFTLEDRLALLDMRIEFLQNISAFIHSKIEGGTLGDSDPLPTPLPPALLFGLSGLLMLATRLRKGRDYIVDICRWA